MRRSGRNLGKRKSLYLPAEEIFSNSLSHRGAQADDPTYNLIVGAISNERAPVTNKKRGGEEVSIVNLFRPLRPLC
jgi:hypothetical protein